MKRFRYKGRTYAWQFKGSTAHVILIMLGMLVMVACMWFITCGMAVIAQPA